MTCGSCGTENREGRKFCSECAAPLAVACPACGAPNQPGEKFCGECATLLPGRRSGSSGARRGPPPRAGPRPPPSPSAASSASSSPTSWASRRSPRRRTRRRSASSWAGTSTSPGRSSSATAARSRSSSATPSWPSGAPRWRRRTTPSGPSGPPWSWPTRSRRSARAIRARCGVLTGEAAVTLGATGQGLVAGDLVNTAARLQSAAPPGSVLVGESTMQATSAAIAYEEAGEQVLKGKTAPVPAWRALRVVAERGGRGRSDLPEPPFVGRDEELRMLKDAVTAVGRDSRARLVSITGPGGIGKSRLAWELEKWADGVTETLYWHRGRSPSYGEGISFWALGEMVRRRAGLAESDDEATTRERIAATVAEFVPLRRGSPLGRAGAPDAPGARAGPGRRARCPLRRLAHLLRADRGAGDDDPPVRGPAVGRLRPPRLRRPAPGLVAELADPGRDPRPARADRPAPQLGCGGPLAHDAGPRAAVDRGDARAPRRLRARAARDGGRGDPGTGRRHPALCRRDRPGARGRGPPRDVRRRLPSARRPHDAGHPGHAALAHRVAPRRPGAGRSRAHPGGGRAGPELHAGRAGRHDRRGPGEPGRPAGHAGPTRAAVTGGGPPVARAGPVLVRPVAHSRGRLRDAGPTRSARPAPGRGPLVRVARRRGARRGPGVPLPRGAPCVEHRDRRPTRWPSRHASPSAGRPSEPPRSGPTTRRSATCARPWR